MTNDFIEPVERMYATDDQLSLLARRIEQLHPDAAMLEDDGCFYMAQVALATGAQALPAELGEIKVWREGPDLVFMLGFHYHNRMAQEKGGYILLPEPEAMPTSERNLYKLAGDDVGLACGVLPLKNVKQFVEWGMDFRTVVEMRLGVSTGIGVVKKKEVDERGPAYLVTGETWYTVASRRCIKSGLVKAFGGFAKPMTFIANEMAPAPSVMAVGEGYSMADANEDLF